ncbi:hypothetical protein PB01_19375 [Psychrobacillus glaciei]|uniref:2-keto-3-deoxygluconate kinase n=1 Tax=Psychrobacillus glaciei TaxID=2283160 RepID=A0A5J6STK1_9BACI|nr:hypothetical protein [Psychrobacillus glaciei]QFG00783.1 hypothetical protein PB01_19375 [Psychrobacillus glaciei]
MKSEKFKDFKSEGHHRGERYRGRDGSHGPKTFRRGRAIAFLERMNLKRSTIMEQLDKPEFQSIQPILVGELKAIDMVINEFVQLFEIHEKETMDTPKNNEGEENSVEDSEKSLDNDEEGIELNETN